jgi:hypothetical protein
VVAVGGNQVVLPLLEDHRDPDRHRLLPAVEVAETADPLSRPGVFLVGPLLKAADQHHLAQQVPLALPVRFTGLALEFVHRVQCRGHGNSACRLLCSRAQGGRTGCTSQSFGPAKRQSLLSGGSVQFLSHCRYSTNIMLQPRLSDFIMPDYRLPRMHLPGCHCG